MWQHWRHVRCAAQLEAAGGNHLLLGTHLDGEVLGHLVQNGIGTVVKQRQRLHNECTWPSRRTSTWEASSRAAESFVGWTGAAAVLCHVERFSDLLKVALICDIKLSREVSGSVTIWPGKTRGEPKTAWEGVMSVSSPGVACIPSMTHGRC